MDLGFADCMGPRLRAEVERQLLEDLAVYNVNTDGLILDWSDSCVEGHRTTYLDGDLENWSGVGVVDTARNLVAGGWIDFIHGGEDNPLYVFWDNLTVFRNGIPEDVKRPGIPQHIWDRLSDETRDMCTTSDQYDAAWANDPLVVKWRQTRWQQIVIDEGPVDLALIRRRLSMAEKELSDKVFVCIGVFKRDGHCLALAITDALRRKCKKGRVWKSKEMLTSLKNARYGFADERSRSRGGADGIFLLDRGFRPENEMMRKIFSGFLDRPGSGATEIASELGVPLAKLLPVRLVSHHLRLLGVLARKPEEDWLVLVDYDDTK